VPGASAPISTPFAAVVVAGGAASRLSGTDKALVELGGRSLLDRALDAVAAATETVVVGPARSTRRPVTWAREQPAGGGPAAGVLAGVSALTGPSPVVAVLAVDMPFVSPATFERLLTALLADPARDGAVLVDGGGRRQPLCAAYRTAALLRRAGSLDADGLPMRRLVAGLALVDVPGVGDEPRDVDTWADLRSLSRPDRGGTVA
jgi:molybdopterin-guanine dinucleotide biosynthesis protein A